MKTFLKNMAAAWQAIPEILENLKSLNSSSSKYQDRLTELQIDNYLLENLHKNPKYDSPKKLNRYELSVLLYHRISLLKIVQFVGREFKNH